MIVEDWSLALAEMGVSVVWSAGSVTSKGFLDQPDLIIGSDGRMLNTDYKLTALNSDFGGVVLGDTLVVDGASYTARSLPYKIGDGLFCEIELSK